jgi:hypothetical protein
MNCEKCNELLSDYLDGALGREDQELLNAHFEECLSCFTMHDELNSIVSFCRENRGQYEAPPNEQAMWLRIRNTLEGETARAAAATSSAAKRIAPEHWWTRWTNRSWELSLSQMAMAVAAIVVAVSLATAISLHRMQSNPASSAETMAARAAGGGSNTGATAALASGPLVNLRVRGISQQIDYWQQRVDERKARWSPQRREDFELNLKVLDQAVEERLKELTENPHDEMTEEMLNAVLNNKVELLREFSDL